MKIMWQGYILAQSIAALVGRRFTEPVGRSGERLVKRRLFGGSSGFGMNEILSIAAALIIAGFVVIPGMREFAKSLMESLGKWWKDTITEKIFPIN